jgi:hypothetical protein
MAQTFVRYDINWDCETYADPLQVEFYCIRKGGRWAVGGEERGLGLFQHYKNAMSILWPDDDWHRWADLALENIVNHKYVGLLGPRDSGKTYMASKFVITHYWAFPKTSLAMVSSTEGRGLELRIWGTIKDLFNRGQERQDAAGFDSLPGNVLENLHTITTDTIDEQDKKKRGRLLTRGIICIPCAAGMQAGSYSGISKYIGAKQARTLLVADELPFMGPAFIEAISNLGQWQGAKILGLGNAYDPLDCMGQFCQPDDGWNSHLEPTKTTVWKTKWPDGVCVNFVGTDSPNFDYPESEPVKHVYLVNRIGMRDVIAFWGEDSTQYYSQCVGVYKPGLLAKRFWSQDFCKEHKAHDMAFWDSTERTRLASLDAAYGGNGGDRCVFRWGEFGLSHDGRDILRVERPEIVPVSAKLKADPEDQIAQWCFGRLTALGIPFSQLYYDSTGRGTLGAAFAKLMKDNPPTPVEFGGRPSARPVRHDLFVIDEKTGEQRLKRCDEQYLDFVSELWFSLRHMVHAEQLRELDLETAREGCLREIGVWSKKRDFVESKHNPQHRKKMPRSPDLMDNLVTMVEGARRLGFQIEHLGGKQIVEAQDTTLQDLEIELDGIMEKHLLRHR